MESNVLLTLAKASNPHVNGEPNSNPTGIPPPGILLETKETEFIISYWVLPEQIQLLILKKINFLQARIIILQNLRREILTKNSYTAIVDDILPD
jgi:hypothetical protein